MLFSYQSVLSKSLSSMVHRKYCAVAVGHTPGIYTSWQECEKQVSGVPYMQYRLFHSQEAAQDWLSRV